MLIENQQFRRHSSVRHVQRMMESGEFGDLLELHVSMSLDITSDGSPYIDRNVPHFGARLPGGVIGDFLPHLVYLARMFVGPIAEVQSVWKKHKSATPLEADEFRALLHAERATAYLSFSGNAQPDAFILRAIGTRARVEANLFEPPKLVVKRARRGEPALMTLVDGVAEFEISFQRQRWRPLSQACRDEFLRRHGRIHRRNLQCSRDRNSAPSVAGRN